MSADDACDRGGEHRIDLTAPHKGKRLTAAAELGICMAKEEPRVLTGQVLVQRAGAKACRGGCKMKRVRVAAAEIQ